MEKKEEVWLRAMLDVKEVLEKYHCRYFLDTGTLLGAIRENQFIPWDNDIDLGIVDCANPEDLIIPICEHLYKIGYNVTASSHEIDIFDGSGLLNLGIKFYDFREGEYTASFGKICGNHLAHMLYGSLSHKIIFKKGYSSYRLKSVISFLLRKISGVIPQRVMNNLKEYSRIESRDIAIPRNFLSDFSDYNFYNNSFKVPKDFKGYLTHRYGPGWQTPNPKYNFITDDQSIK